MTETQKIVEYTTEGGPEVLQIAEGPVPSPGEGEVVISVRAVGLNPFDSKMRAGYIPFAPPLPRGIGGDFAGVISAVGAGANYFDGTPCEPGDEVLGWAMGAMREHLLVPTTQIARKPQAVPFSVAGSLATAGLTALASLRTVPLTAEDVVLVGAAAGSVGFLYSQLALEIGATVIGTASENNHERLSGIGVTPVTYGEGLEQRVRDAAPDGITAAQDNAGRETIDTALALGVGADRICTIADHQAVQELGVQSPGQYERRAEDLDELVRSIASGALQLPVQAEYPLDEVRDAYATLETRHLSGKIVVTL